MSDDEYINKGAKNFAKTGEGFLKGGKAFHLIKGQNLKLKFQNSLKFSVFDKGSKSKTPIFHFDKPHIGHQYQHINIDPKIAGLAHDPHVKLPPGAMAVGNGTARLCRWMNVANKVLIPIAVVIDTTRVGFAGYKDYKCGTSRNVVETTASVAGGWAGGYGGAVGGAAIGTAFLPGIGTIVGGLIGGIGGGVAGSLSSGAVAKEIGDAVDYNIEEINCESCGESFKARKYQSQKYCESCSTCKSCGKEIKARKYQSQIYCEPCSTCISCGEEIEARNYLGQKYCEPCSTCESCGNEIKARKNKGQKYCEPCLTSKTCEEESSKISRPKILQTILNIRKLRRGD